ncbi:hypothetical protein ACFXG4_08620 [Nocardia sp. NPDC059246]
MLSRALVPDLVNVDQRHALVAATGLNGRLARIAGTYWPVSCC